MLRSGAAKSDRFAVPTTYVRDAAEPDLTELAEAVVAAAKGLRFGSIEVVVHDARVVQIVRTEKRRLVR